MLVCKFSILSERSACSAFGHCRQYFARSVYIMYGIFGPSGVRACAALGHCRQILVGTINGVFSPSFFENTTIVQN